MFRVDVQIPDCSLREKGEFLVTIESSQRSLTAPSSKSVSLFLTTLTIRHTVGIVLRQPNATWKVNVTLGDFLPELQGQMDQWFRMEIVSKDSGSDTGDSLSAVSVRVVLSISRLESERRNDPGGCIRCESTQRKLQVAQMELETLSSQLRVYPQLQKEMESLQVGGKTIAFPQSLAQQERDYFKYALIGMSQRAKLAESLQEEVSALQTRLKDLIEQHEELRTVSDETTGQLSDQLMRCSEEQRALSLEHSRSLETIKTLQDSLQESATREREFKQQLSKLEQQAAVSANVDLALAQCQGELTHAKDALQYTEDRNKALVAELRRMTEETAEVHSRATATHQLLLREKSELAAKLTTCQQELAAKTLLCDTLQAEKAKQEGQTVTLAGLTRVKEELALTVTALERKAKAAEDAKAIAVSKLQIEIAGMHAEVARLTSESETLYTANDKLRRECSDLQTQVLTLNSRLEASNREVSTLTRHLAMLEQALCMQEDAHTTLETLRKDSQRTSELVLELSGDIDTLTDSLLQQSEKTLAGQQIIAKLTEIVERQNAELKVIRRLFRHQSPYIPAEGDVVDQALAQYLSEHTLASPIPFRREEPGVYTFGSKKVFVKVEQGRVIIRVGGGYMNIEEFIAIYAPTELERLESKKVDRATDPLVMKLSQHLEGKDYTACLALTKRSEPSPRR